MAILALVLLAAGSGSEPAWHACAGDAGGAFHTRVAGMSCRRAGLITEAGLTGDARLTRLDHLACTRGRDGQLWAYRCASADGRRQLRFSTF